MPPTSKLKAPQALSTDECYAILDRAQQLIASGWVRSTEAVDKDGHSVQPWSERAVRYCEIGAIRAITHYLPNDDEAHRYATSILGIANAAAVVIDKGSVPNVNDSLPPTDEGHARVVQMFERAKQWLIAMQGG